MTPNPIYLVKILKKMKTHIDGHFALKAKDKIQIFTSGPLKTIHCDKLTDINIKGQMKPQYLATGGYHKIDPKIHKLTQTEECNSYYKENKDIVLIYYKKLYDEED